MSLQVVKGQFVGCGLRILCLGKEAVGSYVSTLMHDLYPGTYLGTPSDPNSWSSRLSNESPAAHMEGHSGRMRLTRKFVVTHQPKISCYSFTTRILFWIPFIVPVELPRLSFVNNELSCHYPMTPR